MEYILGVILFYMFSCFQKSHGEFRIPLPLPMDLSSF